MADVSYYLCSTCHEQFDLDEGGFLWQGFVFCENCDPEECPENCEECSIEVQWGADRPLGCAQSNYDVLKRSPEISRINVLPLMYNLSLIHI